MIFASVIIIIALISVVVVLVENANLRYADN